MTYGEVLMKKKLWQFFLLSALAILLVLAAAAADNVVFIKDGGTGSGATASAPLGDLSTALTAVKAGGTVVICGPYTIADKFVAPRTTGAVTITSVYGGRDYRKTANAALYLSASYFCGGATEFRGLNIINTKNGVGIHGNFCKLTMGIGLVCTYAGDATGYASVLGGANNSKRGACNLTIDSGTWYRVRGGSSTDKDNLTYSITVTVNGGKITDRLYGGPQGTYRGTMSLTVNGGEIVNGIMALIPTADTSVLAADVTVTVTGGRIGGAIDASINNARGVYQEGAYALYLYGGDFTHLAAVTGCPGFAENFLYMDNAVLPDAAVVGSISFGNMIRTNGADPWLFTHDGSYYYIATGGSALTLYRAANLGDFATAVGKVIYQPASGQAWSKHLWSPEIHYFSASDVGTDAAGWYCFVGGSSGEADESGSVNSGQRAYVIKCLDGDNLLGRWGHPVTGEVNVPQLVTFPDSDYNDAELCGGCSVIRIGGKPYITFVSEVGRGTSDFHQVICIAKFKNPWTVVGTPTVICTPTYGWEKGGYGFAGRDESGNQKWYPQVVEGSTAVYGDDGSVFIVYAGSGYWTPYYCLGQLTYKGGNPMLATNWVKKSTPILQKTDELCGTGHASYLTDLSGNRWICYHAYRGSTTTNADGTRKSRNAFVEPYSVNAKTGVVIGDGSTYAAPPDTVYQTPLNPTPLAEKVRGFGTVCKTVKKTSGALYDSIAARTDAAFTLYAVETSGTQAAGAFAATLPAADGRLLYRVRGAHITRLDGAVGDDGRIHVSALAGDGYVCAAAPIVNYGDVNGDGKITLADVILLLRRAAGHTVPDSFDTAAADLDGDEAVTARDGLLLVQKLLHA